MDSINALQPNLICFRGDLVTICTAEAPYMDILRSLRAKDGVVSVLGNHDMLIYTPLTEEQRLMEVERLATYERDSLGWTLLRNAHQIIERDGQTLTIVGETTVRAAVGDSKPFIWATSPTRWQVQTDSVSCSRTTLRIGVRRCYLGQTSNSPLAGIPIRGRYAFLEYPSRVYPSPSRQVGILNGSSRSMSTPESVALSPSA